MKRPAVLRNIAPQVVLLGLAALLNDVSSDIIYPLLPIFLTTTVGATPVILGMIEGSAEALSAFLKLGSGLLSDRLPRRKPFIAGGYLVAGLSRALIAVAAFWPAVFTARLLDRTGKGIRSAPRDAMICDVTPESDRGRAFGLHRAFDHAGAVVGPLLAALMLGVIHLKIRTIFFLAVIPALLAVILLVFFLKETRRVIASPTSGAVPGRRLPSTFWIPIGSIALFYFANSSDVFLILKAYDAGVREAWIPVLWAAHHLVKALFSTHAGAWSDRIDRRNLLIAGWLIYALIYFLFPMSRSLIVFLILFVVYAIPFTLTEGVERAWIGSKVEKRLLGKAFGVYYLVMGIFTLGGTALFGWLYEHVNPATAFTVGAITATVAAASVAVQKVFHLGEKVSG
ncbi:MAG: MFS transporter [Thermoanaerobaculia bacterium]